eukprot:3953724-Amphidinium_carterae.1
MECAPLLGELMAPAVVPMEQGEQLWEWLAPWRRERKRKLVGTMERYVLRGQANRSDEGQKRGCRGS